MFYGTLENAPLDRRAIARAFKKALIQISLSEGYQKATREQKAKAKEAWEARNVTFHSLRHFANAQLRGSVSDETLRKLTGHATITMTDHYDHTTDADIQAPAKAQESRIIPFLKVAQQEGERSGEEIKNFTNLPAFRQTYP
ncbi:MAG: tyrosine-type recombinase/integrase [Spirochaetes bacterium]|nr:tyrosine-type recombinase/integrase [Spirochaetota bacterium]